MSIPITSRENAKDVRNSIKVRGGKLNSAYTYATPSKKKEPVRKDFSGFSPSSPKKKKTVKSSGPSGMPASVVTAAQNAPKPPPPPRPPRKTATAGEAIASSLTGRKPSKTIKNKSPRKSPPRAPERAPYIPPWEKEDWGSKDLVTGRDPIKVVDKKSEPTGGRPTPSKYGRWQDAELISTPGRRVIRDEKPVVLPRKDERPMPPSRGGGPKPQPERAPYIPPWERAGWGSKDLVNEGRPSRGGRPMPPIGGRPRKPERTPGYGGRIGAPPGAGFTMDHIDSDGDGIDDRHQPGPGMPDPRRPSRGGRPMPPRRSQPLYETIYRGRRPSRRSQPRYGRGGRNFLRSRMRR